MPLRYGFVAEEIVKQGRLTQQKIDETKSWLETQDFPELTDEQIVLFLLCCEEQDETKHTIKQFYAIRKAAPFLFDSREVDGEDLRTQLSVLDCCVFPTRTANGEAIVYMALCDTSYKRFKLAPALKLFFMTLDVVLQGNPPDGLIIIFNMQGMSLLHLTTIRPYIIKAFFLYLQEAVQVKVKSIHFLNSVYFVDKFLALIKPFINTDLLRLVHFHETNMKMDEFYNKYVPKQCLTEDFGGELPSVRELHQTNTNALIRMQEFFYAEEKQRRRLLK